MSKIWNFILNLLVKFTPKELLPEDIEINKPKLIPMWELYIEFGSTKWHRITEDVIPATENEHPWKGLAEWFCNSNNKVFELYTATDKGLLINFIIRSRVTNMTIKRSYRPEDKND